MKEMEEQAEDFKETFVKAKEPISSHTILEEVHIDAHEKTIKSHIVCDSSYMN